MPKALLYEISTRSWIRGFGKDASLADVPKSYWTTLARKGYTHVWLMGVWQTTDSSVDAFCFHPNLTSAYAKANKQWQRSDVWGSPYAIDDYILHHRLGRDSDLLQTRQHVNQAGLQLILDFVPNHFNAFSSVAVDNPVCFIQGSLHDAHTDSDTFYHFDDKVFAHGKDPYFPAWTDTIQVDYARPEAHLLMEEKLEQVARFCDGVRCDMAMLVLPDIFEKTWSRAVDDKLHFWRETIPKVKAKQSFTFIAESYWDREAELQSLGFDYTYDKGLLDLLHQQDIHRLSDHFAKPEEWHERSVKFIENHDEDRSMKMLGAEKARSAALVAFAAPGMTLIFAGQEKGYVHRVPVQLALESEEHSCPCSLDPDREPGCWCQRQFYERLHELMMHPAFEGSWHRYPDTAAGVFLWKWTHGKDAVLVAINYTQQEHRIKVPDKIRRADVLNQNQNPDYLVEEQGSTTLILPPYKYGAFEVGPTV